MWADYWDLLEDHGLNADNAQTLHDFLASPLLVMGSGQGLLSLHFLRAGYHVCSVERSVRMARSAARRRGVSTVVADALEIRLPQRFQGVIVSTGVVNSRTLDQGLLPPLLESINRHLVPGGRVALSYFSATPWTRVAKELGLYGRPSNNVLFWVARGDFVYAERLFRGRLDDPGRVHRAFTDQGAKLSSHSRSILAIGKRYIELHEESPEQFIVEHSGYYPFPLFRGDESKVIRLLVAHQMNLLSVLSANGGDTTVLICERGTK